MSASLLATLNLIMCGAKVAQKAAAIPMRTSVRELEGSFFVCTSALSGCGLGLKPFRFIPAKGYPRSMCARKRRIGSSTLHGKCKGRAAGQQGQGTARAGQPAAHGCMRRGRASGCWTRVGRATTAAHFGEQPPAAAVEGGYGRAATDTQGQRRAWAEGAEPTKPSASQSAAPLKPRSTSATRKAQCPPKSKTCQDRSISCLTACNFFACKFETSFTY